MARLRDRVRLDGVPMKKDVFPQTMRTWIGDRLREGGAGRSAINRHLMEVYFHPLKVYFLGTRDRWLGDADDIVQGFFADRLSRESFVEDWLASGLPLRRWLCNGLCFYLKELRRARMRDGRDAALVGERAADSDDPERAMDRAFVAQVVRRALIEAEARCADEGLGEHWMIFERHTIEGRSYQDLERETGIPAARQVVMNRTASKRFREAIRELIARDLPHDDLDGEILALLEDA